MTSAVYDALCVILTRRHYTCNLIIKSCHEEVDIFHYVFSEVKSIVYCNLKFIKFETEECTNIIECRRVSFFKFQLEKFAPSFPFLNDAWKIIYPPLALCVCVCVCQRLGGCLA